MKTKLRTNPWRYFGVLVNGRNFQLLWEGKGGRPHTRRTGFYTTVHIRARNAKEAELRAVNVLLRDKKLIASVRNPSSDPPRMFVERIAELPSFKGLALPRTGFAFYGERKPRTKRDTHE